MGTAVLSFDEETTMMLGFLQRVAFKSRTKTPKKGTTRLPGVRRARERARRYSALVCLESNAPARKSNCGSFSFSVMDNQNGFNLSDLINCYTQMNKEQKKKIRKNLIQPHVRLAVRINVASSFVFLYYLLEAMFSSYS